MIETPISRLLDAEGVPYHRLEHSEPVYTMEAAAAQRGVVRSESDGAGIRWRRSQGTGSNRIDAEVLKSLARAEDAEQRIVWYSRCEAEAAGQVDIGEAGRLQQRAGLGLGVAARGAGAAALL